MEDRKLYIQDLYDNYLQKTEKRGISYGEVAYIESLSQKQLNNLEKELERA